MNINQAIKELKELEPLIELLEKNESISKASMTRKLNALETVTTLLNAFPTGRVEKQNEMIGLCKQIKILFVLSEKFETCKMKVLRESAIEQKNIIKSMAQSMLIWLESHEDK